MSLQYKRMAVLHIFIGVGAIFGGMAAVLNPAAPMGISADVLQGSPFSSFFIPGIILLGFFGLGNLLAGAIVWRKSKITGYLGGFFGAGMMIWIAVQCYILWAVTVLHVIYFLLGAVQALWGLKELKGNQQFPFSWIG